MFIPKPVKVNDNQAKAYCHISLLSFMQKTMQKLVTRNIRMKYLGMFPTTITIYPQTREVRRNCIAPCDYTYTGSSGKQEVTLELSQIFEGASKSTSSNITNAAKWHGFGDTLQWRTGSMLGGRKITATLTGETMEGPVAKCFPQKAILLLNGCEALK
jgi:hypothetical protein